MYGFKKDRYGNWWHRGVNYGQWYQLPQWAKDQITGRKYRTVYSKRGNRSNYHRRYYN